MPDIFLDRLLPADLPWLIILPLLVATAAGLWATSRKSLAGLGKMRRLIALGLRICVASLIICALSGVKYQLRTDRMTVIFLLDQSLSVPLPQRQAMISYVNASIKRHRRDEQDDRTGVIVFGRDAAVEVPPVDFDVELPTQIETFLDQEFTDLAGAMRRAMALLTGDSANRIVIITDGNENLGDALRQARAMTDSGISIDVIPVPLAARTEVSVEKVAIPADVRKDQPFDLRVVLNAEAASRESGMPVRGKLRVTQQGSGGEVTIENQIELTPPGKRVFVVPQTITQADFYRYTAEFIPDDPTDDGTDRNNRAQTFTHVRGRGIVLLIENAESIGRFDKLSNSLRTEGLEVEVQPTSRLFSSLPELQRYDAVILANVPRAGGDQATAQFSDQQIEMLVRNTQLGCGLIMIGGPDSFGAGGWTGTGIEKAMPVNFEIKSKKVRAVGALVLTMHAGEMPRANFWQRRIAREAIKALGYQDWCGIVQWSGSESWMWNQADGMWQVGPQRNAMLARVDRMQIGDMPSFDPSMQMAAAAFSRLDNDPNAKPAVKHMIIISDGDPDPPTPATMSQLQNLGVKVTTVAVPSHGTTGSQMMQDIANKTGGKYYEILSGNALPRIYQKEVRRVAQSLLYEPGRDLFLQQVMPHEMLKGIDSFPPIRGFVMTTVKDGPLPEVVLRSPEPGDDRNATILAGWTYGAGKAVAITTDGGEQWANAWTAWENYDRFYSQVVRWAMRPLGDTGDFSVSTDVRDGKARVIVTDLGDEFVNNRSMNGYVVAPNMEIEPLRIEQVAPGRYVAEFPTDQPGSYSISLQPEAGAGHILTGVSVGYSDEYRDRTTNTPLLEAIAELPANGNQPGLIAEAGLTGENPLGSVEEVDPFRRDLPPAEASRDVWPILVFLASCLFFGDIFVRRVQVGFEWLPPLATRFLRRRASTPPPAETLGRLRSRKAEVSADLAQRRSAATRFESLPDEAIPHASLPAVDEAKDTSRSGPPGSKSDTEQDDAESYTSRLLKAKQQVWKDREQ